jgi:hypothetical protein
VLSGYWNDGGGATQKDAYQWLIQWGISKNWFGYGNTTLYAEYGQATDWGASEAGRNFVGTTSTTTCPGPNATCSAAIANFIGVNGVVGTDVSVWGLGIVQKFDAAATDLYVGYRHFDPEITCNTANCGSAATGATNGHLPVQGIDVVAGGARVQF